MSANDGKCECLYIFLPDNKSRKDISSELHDEKHLFLSYCQSSLYKWAIHVEVEAFQLEILHQHSLSFTSQFRCLCGPVLDSIHRRVVSTPRRLMTTIGSVPLCFDLLILSQNSSTNSPVSASIRPESQKKLSWEDARFIHSNQEEKDTAVSYITRNVFKCYGPSRRSETIVH